MPRNPDVVSRDGLSPDAVAEAIGMSPMQVLELLQSECERGIVVETPDGSFRLSERAEQLFGPALRGLPEGPYRPGRRLGRWAA